MKHSSSPAKPGFALVLTLIMLALLSIAVVGFLSSSGLDRATAHAAANKAQAELAAQAAANAAISLIAENVTRFPDSATVWEQFPQRPGDASNIEGTLLYYSDKAPNSAGAERYIVPLMSTGSVRNEAVPLKDKARVFGIDAWDNENSIDINRKRSNEDEQGWVGASPDVTSQELKRRPLRARWVDMKEMRKGLAEGHSAREVTTSRYAFWMEDESFRVNLNQLGAKPRKTYADSPGTAPQEIPLQGLFRSAYLPRAGQSETAGLTTVFEPLAFAETLVNARTSFLGKRFPELGSFNELAPDNFPTDSTVKRVPLADETKFLNTIYSGGLNLSRHGTQRVNLNGLGLEAFNPTIEKEQESIKRIVETIKYHAPKFHQRFYRSVNLQTSPFLNKEEVPAMGGPFDYQNIYLHKIAANIHDYIDPDCNPTMITNTGAIAPRGLPDHAFTSDGGTNKMWAQGKDSAPFLQESLTRFRGSVSGGQFDLRVDYYLEFWNMTNRDVYAKDMSGVTVKPGMLAPLHLGDAVLKIVNQLPWVTAGSSTKDLVATFPTVVELGRYPNDPKKRDLTIDLVTGVRRGTAAGAVAPDGVVFKAGACTVITTDPDGITGGTIGGVDLANTYYCANLKTGYRQYKGPIPAGSTGIRAFFRELGKSEDYETETILANNHGYLESMPFAFSFGGPPPSFTSASVAETTNGGSLYGNASTAATPSQLGDPRTNNEQIVFTKYANGGTSEPDQTRYFNQSGFTLGNPNSGFTYPPSSGNRWSDYYKGWEKTTSNAAAHQPNPDFNTAPAVVLNGNLQSIGQLGDVFDPARVKGTAGSLGINGSRGGGRTLKIGQPDDRVEANNYSAASRQWASYRLTDFFSTSSDMQLPGLININGFARDNGAALRAACFGMSLRTTTRAEATNSSFKYDDKPLNSEESATPLQSSGIQRLLVALRDRMKNNDPREAGGDASKYLGPLMERGEIGDFPIFNTGSNLVQGVNMAEAFDRSREELSQRLMELITTRGNVFSVYAVGQSIAENPTTGKKSVTATHQVKVTFQLIPVWSRAGDPYRLEKETWNPTIRSEVEARFTKPDHYNVQVLSVSGVEPVRQKAAPAAAKL